VQQPGIGVFTHVPVLGSHVSIVQMFMSSHCSGFVHDVAAAV
jgi:hypothetical protein